MMKKSTVVKKKIRGKKDKFKADLKTSGKERGYGNVGEDVHKIPAAKQDANNVAAECCGVDDSKGEVEDKSNAMDNINDQECNVAEDTKDKIGIIFDLEEKEVKVCLMDLGSYKKFNKECYLKGYKSGVVGTYHSTQLGKI
jgi:hypothetical protein